LYDFNPHPGVVKRHIAAGAQGQLGFVEGHQRSAGVLAHFEPVAENVSHVGWADWLRYTSDRPATTAPAIFSAEC
jgi:hypothetical protein